ncbi:MAG: PepSY domain-containing protein [Magnetococcales bacterium]|nr:PepSY domain-containing protein [Magnetococcales bacterium]
MKPSENRPTKGRTSLQAVIRSIHSWTGLVVFPLLLIVGVTGYYLNHESWFKPLFETEVEITDTFEKNRRPVHKNQAMALAKQLWPQEKIRQVKRKKFKGIQSYHIRTQDHRLIVTIPYGHFFVQESYWQRTYAPNGEWLESRFDWDEFMEDLHTGKVAGEVGEWLSDITAICLVLFSLSGIYLMIVPRWGRYQRRKTTPQRQN